MLVNLSQIAGKLNEANQRLFQAKSDWIEGDERVTDTPLSLFRPEELANTPTRPGQSLALLPFNVSPAIGISPTGLQLSIQRRKPLEDTG